MRESNSRLVEVNRAVRVISQAEYDRRALDCTSALPLLNTLLSLSYQVTISPTVRSMLVIDGGLERIVHILVNCRKLDPLSIRKRHTALECLYNICTRGTEFIRVRMVETGVADLALAVLWKSLILLYNIKQGNLNKVKEKQMEQQVLVTAQQMQHQYEQQLIQVRHQLLDEQVLQQRVLMQLMNLPREHFQILQMHLEEIGQVEIQVEQNAQQLLMQYNEHEVRIAQLRDQFLHLLEIREQSVNQRIIQHQQRLGRFQQQLQTGFLQHPINHVGITQTVSSFNVNNSYSTLEEQSQIESTCISRQRSTFIKRTPQMQKPKAASNLTGTMNTFLQNILDDKLFGQEQHVCLALRMIAFLTKHFSIRKVLHSKYDHSLFAVVERFTHTDYTDEIKTWARAILLHFCKREGLTDGLRRCANLECDKWESHPREFLKCNNCRRVRYCSQSCQQNAWKGGHEFWCCIRMNSEGFLIKY